MMRKTPAPHFRPFFASRAKGTPGPVPLIAVLVACALVVSLFPAQWALAEPSSADEGVQRSDAAQASAMASASGVPAPASDTAQPASADEEPLEYGETLNDGTTLVPVEDNASLSSASLMGFDTTRENTLSEEYGTDNPVNGWVGVTPLEYGWLTYDPYDLSLFYDLKSPLWLSDITKTTAEELDSSVWWRQLDYDFSAGGNTIGAVAPVDLDHDGLDDLAVLTSDGKVGVYNVSYGEARYFGGLVPDQYRSGVIAVLDPGRSFYPRTEGTASRNQIDLDKYKATMQEPNLYHLKAGDLDGNGYEDVVMFSYDESGAGWLDVWYTFYIRDTAINSSTPLPAGWQLSKPLGESPRSGDRFLFYHQSIAVDNTPLLNGNIYSDNVYLPASLEVADLSGNGKAEVIVAFQGGDPLGGSQYCSAIQVVRATAGVDQQIQAADYHGNIETTTVTQPDFQRTCARWAPEGNPCTQMTSVSVGDIDADNYPELVVGGYAGSDALQGELYLSYLEWIVPENGADEYLDTANVHGFTWLTDDNGLHKTTDSYLPGHGANNDTSLYFEDADSTFFKSEASNYEPYNLSRYTNTSNWTVPLNCVSLTGYVNNNTYDQVFFGSFFYSYDRGNDAFALWRGNLHEDFNEMDNNNLLLMLSEPAVSEGMVPDCDSPDAGLATMMDYGGAELLYQAALFDQTKDHGDSVRIDRYTYHDNGSSVEFSWSPDKYRIEWGDHTPHVPFLANLDWIDANTFITQDKDSMFLRLVGHEFVYTEPVIESVLQAPPSFEDVSLATGYDSGSTALTRIEGDTVEYGVTGTVSFDFNILYGAEAGKNSMKVGKTPGFGVSPAYKGSKTHDEQFTVNVSKGQDSVVLTCTPMDLYYYEVLRPGAEEPLDLAVMRAPDAPIVKTLPIETYAERVGAYNEAMNAYNENRSEEVPPLTLLPEASELKAHAKGRPDTYARPDGLDTSGFYLTDTLLTLDYGNDFGSSSQSLLSTWKNTNGGSSALNLKLGLKFEESTRFNKFTLAFGLNLSVNGGKSVYNGTAYKGDVKCLTEEWNDYGMSMTMYAGKKTYASPDGSDGEYAMVGYDTENVRYGVAVPRDLRITGTTAHSVSVEADIPWGASNSDSAYLLERLDPTTGQWQMVHTFEKPNLDDASEVVAKETFTDQGGADGNGADERLVPNTSYTYRVTDSQRTHSSTAVALTQKVDAFTASFNEFNPWGIVTGRAVSAETGWRYVLSDGAMITDGSGLTFSAMPLEGWRIDTWQVTETRDGVAYDLADDPRVAVINANKLLIISEAHGDIDVTVTAVPSGDAADPDDSAGPLTPDAVAFDNWNLSVLGGNGEVLVSDERISFPGAEEARASASTGDAGVQAADAFSWITDEAAGLRLAASNADIASVHLTSPFADELTPQMIQADKGRISKTERPLPDGTHKATALAQSADGSSYDARAVTFAKDAQKPSLQIWCVDGEEEDGSRTIMAWPSTGPSDVARMEIARGENADDGFVDVTGSYKKGITCIDEWADPAMGPDDKRLDDGCLENGWYTLRLTNGAGVVFQTSVEMTGVTHPVNGPKPDPDVKPTPTPDDDTDPAPPPAPTPDDDADPAPPPPAPDGGNGGGDNSNNVSDNSSNGDSNGNNGSGSGGGKGDSSLAETGDAAPLVVSALALAAVAALAMALMARTRRQ